MEHYTPDSTDARELLAAQERLNRKRQDRKAAKIKTTSTREPGLSENQDFQESHDLQVMQESPLGDLSDPKADSKDEVYAELFNKGEYAAIPEAEFVFLSWQASEGRNWQEDGTSETWEFCRYLCAHPIFKSLATAALVRKLRRLIDIEDEHLEIISVEIGRVKMAKGQGPLDWAMSCAAQYPLTDPEDLGFERYNRFLSIAGWLQVQRGNAPVYLPVEKLAKLLGVSARQVSTWRALAQRQGLLTETCPYRFRQKATEFRFAVERFGVLRERGNL
jgi:hypothetical protein